VKSLLVLEISLLPVVGRRERTAFEMLKEHTAMVVRAVERFEEAMVAYFDGKLEEGERIASEVYRLETKADRIRAEFENQLGVGAFLPSFRGELAKLSERLDDVADRAEEAVREIKLRPKVFEDLTRAEKKDRRAGAIRLGLVELAGKATKTTKALERAIVLLLEDMDSAARRAFKVDELERESDAMEEELLQELYRYEELLPPVTVMQIKDAIKAIGEISNMAQDVGDILSSIVYSLKA